MEQLAAQKLYAELNSIKGILQKLDQEIERLSTLIVADNGKLDVTDYMSIVGLGASGIKDISEQHDRYVGEAIAHEHLR